MRKIMHSGVNMRYCFCCSLILICSLLTLKFEVSAQNSIRWEDNKSKIKIKATGAFSKIARPKLLNSRSAPEGSTARYLAVDGYQFKWRPSWNFVGMGGDLLPYIRISRDGSALGIVETLPQKGAPSSSIVVFMNLYNQQLVNYLVMPGKNVRKFCFIPFSSKIACLIKRPEDKYYPEPEFELSVMDAATGETVATSPVFKEQISTICASRDGSKLYAISKDSDKIRIYEIDKLSTFNTAKTVSDPVTMRLSADGKYLVVVGSEQIQILDTQQGLVPERTFKLPAFFNPEKLVLCSEDGNKFLLSRLGEETYFYNGKKFKRLCKISDNDLGWSKAESRIFLGIPLRSVIQIFNPDSLEAPESEFRFRKLRPKSDGLLNRIIPLPKRGAGVLILDKRGALCNIYTQKQKWKKKIIISEPEP